MPDYKATYYPEVRFGGYSDIDGTIAFYLRVNSLMTPNSVVLDVGCGRGAQIEDPIPARRGLKILRGKCQRVIGIDVDMASGAGNSCVDEFREIEGPRWPVDTESVDLALADFVLEHVEDPGHFFSEVGRVVKPGGYLCIRTPNVISYFGLLSRLVPNSFHASIAAMVQVDRQARDTFRTFYRCNTKWRLRRMLSLNGFDHCVYGFEAEPSYLSFSRVAYLLGVLHQRFAPRILRVALFAFARKQLCPHGPARGSHM